MPVVTADKPDGPSLSIYERGPRQGYEEGLRSIGAFIDQRGLSENVLAEVPEGFILQGLVQTTPETAASDSSATITKETYTLLEEHIARSHEESAARRRPLDGDLRSVLAGPYERSLRVVGRYVDDQRAKDISFVEQGGAYLVRLLMASRQGARLHACGVHSGEAPRDGRTRTVLARRAASQRASSHAGGLRREIHPPRRTSGPGH